MTKTAHIIGNGDKVAMYKPAKGLKIACNIPPFPVNNIYTTCIVDFKMCRAIDEGSVIVNGDWTCGFRPKVYCENNPSFLIKFAQQIKEFYIELPKYAKVNSSETIGQAYTNFNCGHFASRYAAKKLGCDEIHMYGFDSLFDWNMRSYSDLVLNSDRGNTNNHRLIHNWRPVWLGIFNEFKDTQFVLYHSHNDIKIKVPKNVEIRTKN